MMFEVLTAVVRPSERAGPLPLRIHSAPSPIPFLFFRLIYCIYFRVVLFCLFFFFFVL